MNAPEPGQLNAVRGDIEESWHRFLDLYQGLRPELYRYCRHLTRSAFEADDLAQDAMFRSFVTLGCMAEPPANPRAWLFRVASNLWIDRLRAGRPARPTRRLKSRPRPDRGSPGSCARPPARSSPGSRRRSAPPWC